MSQEVKTWLPFSRSAIIKRMQIGWFVGLLLISSFIFRVDNPDPAWGRFWMIRPLVVTPLVAAFGFLSFFLRDYIRPQSDAGRIAVFIISLLAFVVALWLGTILGLDGTLWN